MSRVADRIANFSPEKLRQLARRANQKDRAAVQIPRASRETEFFPLSFGQERLWFLDRLFPNSSTYNLPFGFHFQFPKTRGGSGFAPSLDDLVRLHRKTIDLLIQRHEVLRTSFPLRDGSPVQSVNPAKPVPLEIVQLEGVAAEDQIEAAKAVILKNISRPFYLGEGNPCRFGLIQLNPSEYVGFGVFHHIVFDAWSQKVAVEEFQSLLLAALSGESLMPPELAIQYADYAVWQRERWGNREVDNKLTRYWKQQLAGLSLLELPADHPRPLVQSFQGKTETFFLDSEFCDPLRQLSQSRGVTLFATLLAAWTIVLKRHSGSDDIAVCVPVANRTHVELEPLIGFFVNTLVMRIDLSGDPSFAELQKRAWDVCTQAYEHQEMPFERLVQELQPSRDLSRNPLSAISFQLQDIPTRGGSKEEGSGMSLAALEVEATGSAFDLDFTLSEQWDSRWIERGRKGIRGKLTYNTDIFEAESVRSFIDHFQTLLAEVVKDPEGSISKLEMLTAREKRRMLIDWNSTERSYPKQTIVQLFEAQAAKTPELAALEFEGETLSYADLNARANQLAQYLKRNGVACEVLVGLLMERSFELVIGVLGILKAGGAYVPLDPEFPPHRLRMIAEDASLGIVLTQSRLKARMPDVSSTVLALDEDWEQIGIESESNPVLSSGSQNAAYVIYTSGSTGMPKGVINVHEGLVNRLQWMQERYRITEDDRVLQKTPYSFDVSVWELLWPLMTGARMVLARSGGHQDPGYITEVIQRCGVTTVHFVPSMLSAWLRREDEVRGCTSLRRVICSGEALSAALQDTFHALSAAELHNLYGPTEASIDVTAWQCQRESDAGSVPIGKPIANIQVYVLDGRLEPVPVGTVGTLYLAGIGLARGYLGRPEITAKAFMPNPFSGRAGDRMYCTQDSVRFHADGALDFLGRRDNQVKVRGFRIELGEIEAILGQHPSVQEAAVTVTSDGTGAMRILAYIVARESIGVDELRRYLRERVPEYMVPAAIILLDAMPLNANGKLDRKALVAPDSLPAIEGEGTVAPRNPTEQLLLEIWRRILGANAIGMDDSFFDLGGHSLLAVRLLDEVNSTFQVELPLRSLFQPPTIAGLAEKIRVALGGGSPEEAEDNLDLDAEAVLDSAIIPKSGWEFVPPRNILLTGATGFLGAYLVAELLERTEARVMCLLRAFDSREGMQRLQRHMASLNLWRNEYSERVFVVCGDLAMPQLGLSSADYTRLAGECDTIYHSGAMVNFFYPYRVMKGANVVGTEEILRLACHTRQKAVHYISSMGVFPQASILVPDGEWPWTMREDDSSDWRGLGMGYTQSKWVAERLAHLARARGIPIAIYRPTITYGHTETGHGNERDFLYRLIFSCSQLGFVPEIDSDLNLVPIDFVIKGIVDLSLQAGFVGQVFHLVNPEYTPLEKVLDCVVLLGGIERIPYEDWRERLSAAPDNVLAALARNFPEHNSDMRRDRKFHSDNADRLLHDSQIRCPGISSRMIELYVSRILDNSGAKPLTLAGAFKEKD